MIIKELTALIKGMELEDLAFLKNQAEVLEHNRRVLKEREERAEAADVEAPAPPPEKDGEKPRRKGGQKSGVPSRELRIEQSDNPKYFNICSGDVRIFMDRHEIRALYGIASAAADGSEAAPRLYRWLKKERSDALAEIPISGAGSPALGQLYRALIENFTTD